MKRHIYRDSALHGILQESRLTAEGVYKTNLRPDLQLRQFPTPGAADSESAEDAATSSVPAGVNTRAFQLGQWDWDVFISHAGEDKAFGRSLHRAA